MSDLRETYVTIAIVWDNDTNVHPGAWTWRKVLDLSPIESARCVNKGDARYLTEDEHRRRARRVAQGEEL